MYLLYTRVSGVAVGLLEAWLRSESDLVYGGQDMKFVGMMLLLMGAAAVAVAGQAPTPEIDANSSASALLLLSGGLLMLRSRWKK
jgi:hypothetical protein